MTYKPRNLLKALATVVQGAAPQLTEVGASQTTPNARMPYAIVSDVSNIPAHYFGTDNDDFYVRIQIDVFDRREGSNLTMEELEDISEAIYRALNKQFITVEAAGGVNCLSLSRGSVRQENANVNRVTHQFMILGSENN